MPPPSSNLLLAAHGSGDDSPANALIRQLASRLTPLLPGVHVSPAFNLGTPSFSTVLSSLDPGFPSATIVPIMTGRGWFVDTKLPAEFGKHPDAHRWQLTFTPPVGCLRDVVETTLSRTHNAFLELAHSSNTTPTLLVVAHGSARSPASVSAGRRLARLLASKLQIDQVHAAFLDDQPLLEDLAPTLPSAPTPLLVLPWLIGGGQHANRDIPDRLGPAFAHSRILPALGDDLDLLTHAVLCLYRTHSCAWAHQCCTINLQDHAVPPVSP